MQVAILMKVAIPLKKRNLIEFIKHSYTFEKIKSNKIHEI